MTGLCYRIPWGAYITGGTLGGNIFNNSKIFGYFQDVRLETDTHIIGSELRSDIIGDPEYPAKLEILVIKKGCYFENVIIANDVIFENENQATIGDNVVFLP